MIDEHFFSIRVNAGMGGYWEAEVIHEGKTEVFRSYRLANLIEVLEKLLLEYNRKYA